MSDVSEIKDMTGEAGPTKMPAARKPTTTDRPIR